MNKTTFAVKVKASKIDGKGLFAEAGIPARKKIGELTGQVITVSKARRLAKKIKRIAIVELDYEFALDASNDTTFKYINHSCNPNTYMRVIRHQVEFYSLRKIELREELTCNYGETHHDGALKCSCGAEGCKQYL
ncbi:MAG: SET domain-containing protein [Ferruginibacter sp.]